MAEKFKVWVGLAVVFLFLTSLFYWLFISAPTDFQSGRYFEIKSGWSISEAANFLGEQKIIRSPLMFKVMVRIIGKTGNVTAGEFKFDKPVSLFSIVGSLTDVAYKGRAIKVTIPEGFTNKDIAELLDSKLPNFDKANFLKIALPEEGSLFPDTYIFPIAFTEDKIVNKMFDNFQQKITDIKPAVIASKRTRIQIIIMASILEKEARTTATREIISGILWKRLDAGRPLQIDASFLYLLNKKSSELTGADLNTNSLYNTYLYKGLPPGAISNPGLDALTAALYPTESKYWFYLSDKEGNMHYAETFDEHKKNKALYLNH